MSLFQVLSESVGTLLEIYGLPEEQELAKVILLMDKFFDAMNVSCHGAAQCKLKPFLLPYTSTDDHRFHVNTFHIGSCDKFGHFRHSFQLFGQLMQLV